MALSQPKAGLADAAPDHGFHPLRIARVIHETDDARSYVLEVPDALRTTFTYQSGQFCTFRVRVGGQSLLRCYSMSSAPGVDAELVVTVKRTPAGVVSNWMVDRLEPGDVVEVTRPAGVFCLTPGGGDMLAFCAGSGITPVHSLLKTALATTTRTVRLLYANHDMAAVIFRSEIDNLLTEHGDRFVVAHHLDSEHGFVQPDDIRGFARDADDNDVYICGPAPFMDLVEGTLLAEGVAPDRIHIERFTPAGDVAVIQPTAPGTGATRVTVEHDGRSEATDHHPGTTILQTARQMGMSPPFSCEAGSCATCMARLVEGTVELRVNNALTDEEVAAGWILTCQAVPTSAVAHVVYGEEG